MRLIYSVRSPEELIYADELGEETDAHLHPRDARGLGRSRRPDRRLDARRGRRDATAFVCGSNGFVEAASQLLVAAGLEPGRIRTERFGPTG